MLKIWGRSSSSNVMKVLWLCEELGLAYERIDAGGAFGRTRDPDYLAKNPNALVPTIEEEDGFTLWESNTILRYLCNTRPGGGALYPAAPRPRAEVERWMDWQLSRVNGPMTTLFFTYVRTPEPQRDLAAAAKARDAAEEVWAILDAQLAGRDFVAGAAFTIADIALGIQAHRWFNLPIRRADLAGLRRWYERLGQRPGYRRHVMVPMS
ncbi:glutathione S-transferase family protein [Caldovatus aquaticus]|uniref:Glutathione S-transferase family protein n=1 Tax=Caldovatus aquaticus TaxID=2865671 RepID=A0ABS7F728_9PROT|nr:glutathione S-transferase family protein [Caldovatus aquaticus]MBW8271419.1 glutathione S-transferase family protein [Caldovatus aquaticus]